MSEHKQSKMRQCHNCNTRLWGTAADLIDHGIGCTKTPLRNLMPLNQLKAKPNWYLIIGLPVIVAVLIVIIYLLEKG